MAEKEDDVQRKIREAREGNRKEVHLYFGNLTRIPDEVFDLHQLEVLNLSNNRITSVPARIRELENLKELDLRGNPVEEVPDIPGLVLDWSAYERCRAGISAENVRGLRFEPDVARLPEEVFGLPNLAVLDLHGPYTTSEPIPISDEIADGLSRLTALESLDVSCRRPGALLDVIPGLPALKSLNLFRCGLTHIPDAFGGLENLRELSLSKNDLGGIPVAVSRLKGLTGLWLRETGVKALPEWLFDLKELEGLGLDNNEIEEVPDSIGRLRKLEALVLSANPLTTVPDALAQLENLKYLGLGGNLLKEIPAPVFELRSLRRLYVDARYYGRPRKRVRHEAAIKELPSEILQLENLEYLNVDGQPIETPPPEVVKQGVEAIKSYWRQIEAGTDYLCEAKLLIVGEPGAGKTTLARKIKDPDYQLHDDEGSTEGIDVIPWSFWTKLRVERGGRQETLRRKFRVNVWDFGGQEIYHATHQFFLTRRSVYVLVADSRKEDTDFHYWLNVVELLSDSSPLVIVKNEKQDRRRDINEGRLRGRFANLREALAANLANNRGLEEVVCAIRRELERLPHIGTPLPATWKKVRTALERMRPRRDHIGLEEYLDLCGQNGFTRLGDKLQLSGYLHDLGICLHFQDDPLLRKTVILNPEWGTDAVYRVLDCPAVVQQHGRFDRGDLETIWSGPKYAPMRDELLRLMMKFGLCYGVEGGRSFIAPQRLSAKHPEYAWDERENLVLKYRYDFMPKGIVTRFIVAVHHLIADQDLVWRDGVVLAREGSRAEVVEDYPQREITVRAAGPFRKDLLTIVDHELEKIHRSYPRLKYATLVPCNCPVCGERQDPHFYPYNVLRRFAADGKPIQCQASYEMVDVLGLVDNVFARGPRPETDRRCGMGPGGLLEGALAEGIERSAPVLEPRKEVFVSYAWGGESEKVVEELAEAFEGHDVTLVRDKSEMRYRDPIRDFMRRIGRGKCIVVVIGKKYLQSKNCMFELTQIAEHGDLFPRVFPIVLDDAKIAEAVDRLDYIAHWEGKITALNEKMKRFNQAHLEGIREDLELYTKIRNTIARLMEILGDMNALTPEMHRQSGFVQLLGSIEAKLSE